MTDTYAHIDAMEKQRKATDLLIKAERKRAAAAAEKMGNEVLEQRRKLGVPDPDGKTWGDRMAKYQIGLRALAGGMQGKNFRVEDVHPRLRQWLAHPILDRPATDDDLHALVDMLTEHETLVVQEAEEKAWEEEEAREKKKAKEEARERKRKEKDKNAA